MATWTKRLVRRGALGALLVVAVMLQPTEGWAQVTGGTISGVVRDESGGVLPGVTVEAASPVLIEKTRTVITDDQGIYRIVDLRPGTYTVVFTLPGFSTFRREGIELTTGFTATVNGDLKVGALEETITVSGATPIVDTQNVNSQRVFAREVAEALPTNRTVNQYITLIPGATPNSGATSQDVGGNKGENVQGFTIHGSRTGDFQQMRDGMFFGTLVAAGNRMTAVNPAGVEETVVQASGGTAEVESGGALVNIIPRDGGNTFRGNGSFDFSDHSLEGDNLDEELQQRGLTTSFNIRKRYDVGGGIGGPIVKDKIWFFGTYRKFTQSEYAPGNYYNATPASLFYNPDLNNPAYTLNYGRDMSGRITARPTSKDKFAGFITNERNCNCFSINAGTSSPEGLTNAFYWPNWKGQVTWSRPHTSRLLLEAGVAVVDGVWNQRHGANDPEEKAHLGGVFAYRSVQDSGRNYRYGAPVSWNRTDFGQINERFAMSYVTGSHNFKTGFQYMHGGRLAQQTYGADGDNVSYTFACGQPGCAAQSVTYYAGPLGDEEKMHTFGLYVQDQWTVGRLTLNGGIRYDNLIGSVPPVSLPAGTFVPARHFPEVKNSPNWKDLNPRMGVAWDVFGTGRTAIKGYLNRYINFEAIGGIPTASSPANLIVTSANRTWTDNGDYIPQENELAALNPSTFGTVRQNTFYADDVINGFGNRGYSWQGSLQIQHEIRQGLGINVGYFRTWYGNFFTTDNRAAGPEDYTQYCIPVPTNEFLPGGGGYQQCGYYDISVAKFGQTDNLVTQSSNFGKQKDVFNGVDVTMNWRFRQGGILQGGLSTGQEYTDVCFANSDPSLAPAGVIAAAPRTSEFCHLAPSWSNGTQVKFSVVYPLMWKLQFAGTYQNNPPIPTTASNVTSNAAILPSLGRNLATCGTRVPCTGTATLELIPNGEFYQEDRPQQIDLRFSRNFQVKNYRFQPSFDIYNITNSNPVLAMNTRYGSSWRYATTVLSPRVLKLGVKIDF